MGLFARFVGTSNTTTSGNVRTQLSKKYIKGQGLEIGALHQPLVNPNLATIAYVDNRDYADLCNTYPEIDAKLIIPPSIVCSGDRLEAVEDQSVEFVIANHVLEHVVDPFGAIHNWVRVLKPDGILYCSVPDFENILDKGRALTTLNHLIADNVDRDPARDMVHYFECAYYWGKSKSLADSEAYVKKFCDELQYSIHFHTFDKALLEAIFKHHIEQEGNLKFAEAVTENVINGTKEYICVLKKIIPRSV